MNRLKEKYLKEIVPELEKEFKYTSIMQVPKIDKIVINMGIGEAIQNPKALEDAVNELTQIAGQKPIITKSKKSIANFN